MSLSKMLWHQEPAVEYVRDLVWDGDVGRRTSARIVVRFSINRANVSETAAAWHAIAGAYAKAAGEPPFRVVTEGRWATELRFTEATARIEETHRPEADFKITFTGKDYPVRTPALLAQALRDLGQVPVAVHVPMRPPGTVARPTHWELQFSVEPIESVLLLEYYTVNE